MKWTTKKELIMQATVTLLLLVSAGVSAVPTTGRTFSTTSNNIELTFHYADEPFMTLTVTPSPPVFGQSILAQQEFATVELPGEGLYTSIGQAQLPTISRFIEIPQGANPVILVESVSWETTSLEALHLPTSIKPVQPSLLKIEGVTVPFTRDDSFYAMDAFFPSTFAEVKNLGELRGRHIAFLQVFPVQYNPVSGDLRIMTHCDFRIELPGSDLLKTAERIDRYTTPSYVPLFETSFINYGALRGTEQIRPKQEGYLIIVDDAFFDAIEPYATWKEAIGFDVTVTKTSEIPSGPTKEHIKTYFVDAYNNWTVPPTYILLVGDVAQIPTWTGSQTGTCTDLYYVTINTDDYFADMIISRFSAANSEQVTIMVDKTMFYEQGVFTNESWIKKAAFLASSDAGGMAEQTHNYVIENYLEPNNYTCDKIYQSQGGSTADVTNALNDGRSLCIYSGHGYSGGWGCVPYDQNDVENLLNQDMYPFVCSHACSTSPFSQSECFGETWLRVENRGGLAFWGASASTYWDEDDILEKRMFQAWWADNCETIGGMTNMGLLYLYEYYSGGGMTKYYFEAYNVLGDSSVKVWRGDTNMNTAPNTPEKPTGPATGDVGKEYTFSTSTTDAQNNEVYYLVSWGDSISDWLGPYPSGETVSFHHTWNFAGEYNITVKAKDNQSMESAWSEAAVITIVAAARIEIGEITGGFGGITARIKNVGGAAAVNVAWSISLDGGLVLLGRESIGTFVKIMPGFSPIAKTKFVFGFGTIDILVTAGDVEKTATAKLIGPFFLNVT